MCEVSARKGCAKVGWLIEGGIDAGSQVGGIEVGIGDFQNRQPGGGDPLVAVTGEDAGGEGSHGGNKNVSVSQPACRARRHHRVRVFAFFPDGYQEGFDAVADGVICVGAVAAPACSDGTGVDELLQGDVLCGRRGWRERTDVGGLQLLNLPDALF